MLTPLEIQNKEFTKELRGYSVREVDEFLNAILRDYERLYKDNADLKRKIDEADKIARGYRDMEKTIRDAIVVATSAGDDIKKNANAEADNIVNAAKNEARSIIDGANAGVRELELKTAGLKSSYMLCRDQIIALLNAEIELLKKDVL